MKLLVISDSHKGDLSSIPFEAYDAVIHCGDYGKSLSILKEHNVLFVKGNCDMNGQGQRIATLFNKKILVTHGHIENVKFDYQRLVYRALEAEVQVCFFGHTHQQEYFIESGVLFLNPGSYPQSYIEIYDEEIIFYQFGKCRIKEYKW